MRALQVVARQLLFDQRPAARKLLQEVLILQDTQSQGRPARLNLQLLEELLLLAAPDFAPPNVTAPDLQQPAWSTAAAAAAPMPDSDTGDKTYSSQTSDMQSLDLLQLAEEQLGLSVSEAAAQLSSPEAAGVRALLAQRLVQRWLHRQHVSSWKDSRQQQQKATPTAGSSPGGVQQSATPAGAAAAATPAVAGRTGGTQHAGGRHNNAAEHHTAAARKTRWWDLLLQAGVSGVRFAGQLLWLAVALLFMRALAWVQQRFKVFGVGRSL
jgi:hypothetical protein